jgi:aspartate/methionine/tyrosine aminotransferase
VSAYALLNKAENRKKMKLVYQSRKDVVTQGFSKYNLEFFDPSGSFFIWAKVPLSMDSNMFSSLLLEEATVAVIPGSVYGANGEGWYRISLVISNARLKEAVKRIAQVVDKYR